MISIGGINIREDLSGRIFGNLSVVSLSHRASKENMWNCVCSCGKPLIVPQTEIKSGKQTSCRCGGTGKWFEEFGHGIYGEDLSGKVFDRLTVISYQGAKENGQSLWLCKCSCGKEKIIERRGLISGTSSCGCKGREGPKPLPNNMATYNKVLTKYKHDAGKRGYSYNLSRELALSIISSNCYYCGMSPQNKVGKRKYSGIDRVDNTRGYEPDNVVPCCKTCNFAKRTMSLSEFTEWIYSLFDHMNARSIKYAR